MMQTVKYTLPAAPMDMGGLEVRQALPTAKIAQIDPYLLLHHSTIPVSPHSHPLHAGVSPHPHRGFSAVTIVISGEIHHRDSLGNSSVIGPGGFQWLHAGRGIVHSERPSAALAEKGGAVEVLQIWVNSPANRKMAPAAYWAAQKNELPKMPLADGAELHLINGVYGDLSSRRAPGEVNMFRVYTQAKTPFEVALNPEFAHAIYVIEGTGVLEGHGLVEPKHMYALHEGLSQMRFMSESPMDLMVLSGQPLQEPLASYGPFVMNTQTQIMEAMRDYQMGKMGMLIEE